MAGKAIDDLTAQATGADTDKFLLRAGSTDYYEVLSTSTRTFSNKTFTAPVLNGSITGTGVLDEDAMGSDSDIALATQQSIKAYVDANVFSVTTSNITDTALNSVSSPAVDTWYQPSAVFKLEVVTGIYLINALVGTQVEETAGNGNVGVMVQLGTSATPGASLFGVPGQNSYVQNTSINSSYGSVSLSKVETFGVTTTIYVNIKAFKTGGTPNLTFLGMRHNTMTQGIIEAIKIG